MIVALTAMITTCSQAQVEEARIVEKQPDPALELTRFSGVPDARHRVIRATDPAIAAMVDAISTDSLRATLQQMQNWGSRFLMNDNKKEIATSLMDRFLAYGYTDVKLDSFYLAIYNWNGLSDSSWQYNVVCTLPGASAPDEIYVVGGHWDSFCNSDPFNHAPGVDDNGTAVAATLEIARVMKQSGYKPEATIRFTLFAAEELGLFGSRYAAASARMSGTDLRFMLNMDMISNNPENLSEVKVFRYLNFEWAGLVTAEATERYTGLSVVFPANLSNSGSDSYPYWLQGFPSVYFEEIAFSPNWHMVSDTLGNCNVPYLKKVTGGALATLAEQQQMPYPQDLQAQSGKAEVTLRWKATKNAFIQGSNIYRSVTPGGEYQKINSIPVADSVYHDVPAELNKQYYYVVATVNDSLGESLYSNEVHGARFNFCDSLLVLANVKGNKTTPDSVFAFYQSVLDTIPFKWMDINATQKVNLNQFSRYRTILWMTNAIDFEMLTSDMVQDVRSFAANGGNLLFAGFSPGRFWINAAISYPVKAPESSLLREVFKADSVNRKAQSMLFRANSSAPGYMTLNVDSLKYLDKAYPGQLYLVDVFAPSPSATVTHRFDTKFDSTSIFGMMKHRPVGLEYMGTDHKSILLSFPLYYLDTSDAREFIHFVMTEKFRSPVGITHHDAADPFVLRVFPNPAKEDCNVTFTLDKPGRVRVSLIPSLGQSTHTLLDRKLDPGDHWFQFSVASLEPGLYHVLLQQEEISAVKKLILVK